MVKLGIIGWGDLASSVYGPSVQLLGSAPRGDHLPAPARAAS